MTLKNIGVFVDATPEGEKRIDYAATLAHQGGAHLAFQACICSLLEGGQKYFVFQLLPQQPAVADSKAPAMDAGLAHKQKLDCALQLARTVSLDFNNALTSILGHTSLVLSKMEPGNPWRNSLMEVEKGAQKAAEIAQDLAAFSRQEKDPRAQTPGNLNNILRRAVELFQRPSAANILWTLQLEKRLYTVNFDEAKMQQCFVKILENAVEAVGRDARITVRTHNQSLDEPVKSPAVQLAAGHYVCVEFADNGCGIAQGVLPRIFEPFFTTKPNPPHRGLGLAWVYGIVTNHGGTVAVTSPPGQGTTVRLFLPAQKKIVRDQGTKIEDLRGSQTVLIVDDEETLLTLGQTVLSAFGYKVLPKLTNNTSIHSAYSLSRRVCKAVMESVSLEHSTTLAQRLAKHLLVPTK